MASYLVIVELPAEVKTIKKSLGANYEIDASRDYVRDLPKSQLGFDAEHDYESKYITIRGKRNILAKLRKEVKKADEIYLATDPDREGGTISWHLMKTLKLDKLKGKDVCRISLNEATENAVEASFEIPREPNMDLVDAQQTRRVLDRTVGYRINPLLQAKVKRGLSAGHIQSVALRTICDHEDEINVFILEEYWSLETDLLLKGNKKPLATKYYGGKDSEGGKAVIRSKEELNQILSRLEGCKYGVEEVGRGERVRKAPIPFTTNTLQQEASKVLNSSTQKAMRLAQQLYEGVGVRGKETLGLITYLHTDSTRIADEADTTARSFAKEHYGGKYVAQGSQAKKEGIKIQDTHEVIRPTDVTLTPTIVKESLQRDLFRLYQLIWKRFITSRMAPAVYETTSVKIRTDGRLFTTSASKPDFEGLMSVYVEADDEEEKNQILDNLGKRTVLKLEQLNPNQHFIQPPIHYTEASLVKALEEQDIGRPSTYAPTITTIIARRYVVKEGKNLYVAELRDVVNRAMKNSFPGIVGPNFTANMEPPLDKVADDTMAQKIVVNSFYPDLDEAIKTAEKELESIKIADEVSDVVCGLCGRQMVIKYDPHGRFLACPGLPECKNTEPYLEKIGIPCPKCGKELMRRKTKRGCLYCGYETSPSCDFMSWQKPSTQKCPVYGSYIVERGNKLLYAGETCGYRMDKSEE